jgi:hypothetical protein
MNPHKLDGKLLSRFSEPGLKSFCCLQRLQGQSVPYFFQLLVAVGIPWLMAALLQPRLIFRGLHLFGLVRSSSTITLVIASRSIP